MKKIISVLVIVSILTMISGCAQSKVLDYVNEGGVRSEYLFKPIGLFTMNDMNEDVQYKVSIGNIIWSVLLVETIVAPIVLIGWYLWYPDEYIGDVDLPRGAEK